KADNLQLRCNSRKRIDQGGAARCRGKSMISHKRACSFRAPTVPFTGRGHGYTAQFCVSITRSGGELMKFTRRNTLKLGMAGAAGLGVSGLWRSGAMAQDDGGDRYASDNGEIVVYPVAHASFVMTVPGMVICCDPVGGAEAYSDLPPPDLILITHEHSDHFEPETLTALAGEEAKIITKDRKSTRLNSSHV